MSAYFKLILPSQSSALSAKLNDISDSNATPKMYCFIILFLNYPVKNRKFSNEIPFNRPVNENFSFMNFTKN